MGDLISRQDAIDAINALHDKPNAWLDCAVDAVMALSTAQPKHDENPRSEQGESNKLVVKTGKTCTDCISRQAAIDAFYKHPNIEWTTLDVLAKINALSSAQPLVIHCTDCKDWLERQSVLGFTISELPSSQPEIIRCKDCKHLQKWRSEESAKKFGQIYECARNVLNCPKPEDFCSRGVMKWGKENKYHDPFGNPIYVYVRIGDKTASIKADDLQKALDYVTEHGEEYTIIERRDD